MHNFQQLPNVAYVIKFPLAISLSALKFSHFQLTSHKYIKQSLYYSSVNVCIKKGRLFGALSVFIRVAMQLAINRESILRTAHTSICVLHRYKPSLVNTFYEHLHITNFKIYVCVQGCTGACYRTIWARIYGCGVVNVAAYLVSACEMHFMNLLWLLM